MNVLLRKCFSDCDGIKIGNEVVPTLAYAD